MGRRNCDLFWELFTSEKRGKERERDGSPPQRLPRSWTMHCLDIYMIYIPKKIGRARGHLVMPFGFGFPPFPSPSEDCFTRKCRKEKRIITTTTLAPFSLSLPLSLPLAGEGEKWEKKGGEGREGGREEAARVVVVIILF